jgi:hypothetical protein
VAGGDHELLAAGSGLQERGWPWGRLGAVLKGQFQSESLQGHTAILGLGSTLRGLCGDACGLMEEHHGGLGLVSVLAARSRSAGVNLLRLLQEVGGRERGGVHAIVISSVDACATAAARQSTGRTTDWKAT